MRVAAIFLPELRVELVRSREFQTTRATGGNRATKHEYESGHDDGGELAQSETVPLVIVVAEPPVTEATLTGGCRIDVVSREAHLFGIRPGQTLAQARSRASDLRVRVIRPDAVREHLVRIAEVALGFGATVSFAPTDSKNSRNFGDLVWVDVTGCAHLHQPANSVHALPSLDSSGRSDVAQYTRLACAPIDGETVLALRLRRAVRNLGHVCSVAIADGPRIAAMIARAVFARPQPSSEDPFTRVIAPGQNAQAIEPLAITSLPLAADDARWLSRVGVRTVRDIKDLPRASLASRLGASARDVLALCDGDDRAPLTPYIPAHLPEESMQLDTAVEGAESLLAVVEILAERLCARLAARGVGTPRVELELTLDNAYLRRDTHQDVECTRSARDNDEGPGRDNHASTQVLTLELPVAVSDASDLRRALQSKIERCVLLAPARAVALRAAALMPKPQAAMSLFEAQPKAGRALMRLVAELAGDLGHEAMGKLEVGHSWNVASRSRFRHLRQLTANDSEWIASSSRQPRQSRHSRQTPVPEPSAPCASMRTEVPEPTRLVEPPQPVARKHIHVLRHLSRVDCLEWWKAPPEAPSVAPRSGLTGNDYVMAWIEKQGIAWVEIDRGAGAYRIRGWFD